MTVYVTQETDHAFKDAERYGDVEFLTHLDLRNIEKSAHNEHMLADIAFKLKKYDESQDWIVVAGSPYVSAAVFLILGRKGVRQVRVLRWDNRDFKYIPLTINI